MRKYIDAEALKHILNASKYYGTKAGRDFADMITECDVADTPRWIPVTERLPDINDHYTSDVCLVYCDNGAYAFAELEENIFGQVGWDCEREDEYHESVGTVIAWMPLPEPYKGGEQNE